MVYWWIEKSLNVVAVLTVNVVVKELYGVLMDRKIAEYWEYPMYWWIEKSLNAVAVLTVNVVKELPIQYGVLMGRKIAEDRESTIRCTDG
jgi:hypothetical protein